MKLKKCFPGGIHPTDGGDKELSGNIPAITYIPDRLEISLSQSMGSRCRTVLPAGSKVKKGQLIAEPVSFPAVNLHAGISGRIIKSKDAVCIIEADGNEREEKESTTAAYRENVIDLSAYGKEYIINAIREGGILGMGGAGFPAYKKYETDWKIDTLLINGAECEPFLTCDYRLMLEEPYAVLNGIRLLIIASGAQEAVLCVERNKQEAADRFREILAVKADIRLEILPVRYPQGGERQLIQTVTGKEVPAGGFPADLGVLVSNVATAKACADCVIGGEACTERIVTVTGLVKNPGNYRVPIGTTFRDLLHAAGGCTVRQGKLIVGGPMTGTGMAFCGSEMPVEGSVTKTTSGLLVMEDEEVQETPCIRCGACGLVCPAGLTPYEIDFAWLNGDFGLCRELYAKECIQCGCCSYVCPARRMLAHRIGLARRDVIKQDREGRGK